MAKTVLMFDAVTSAVVRIRLDDTVAATLVASGIAAFPVALPTGATVTPVTPPPAPTLGTLTLSGTLKIGVTAAGNILGATAGSTITSNIPGITVDSASRTYSGTPTGSAATIANGLVETLGSAINTPNASPITVAAATNGLGTLTLTSTLRSNVANKGKIIGATDGSTIVSNIPGVTVDSASRTWTGTPTSAAGTNLANGLVESLNGTSKNSAIAVADVVALPALPLTNPRVGGYGDSQIGFGSGKGGTAEKGLMEGLWGIYPNFNYDSFYVPGALAGGEGNPTTPGEISGANQGVPGGHIIDIIDRLDYLIARKPQIVMIAAGTNSIATGDGTNEDGSAGNAASGLYVANKLLFAAKKLISEGIYVVVTTIYPRADAFGGFDTAMPNSKRQAILDANGYIKGWPSITGLRVIDPYTRLASTTDANGTNRAFFAEGANGVHLNAGGVSVVTRNEHLPVWQSLIAATPIFNQDPSVSNLFPSTTWSLKGSTGTKITASGTVATGCTARLSRQQSGDLLACSKVVQSGVSSWEWQGFDLTNGGAAAWSQAFLNLPDLALTPAVAAAGSWVQFYLRVRDTADAPTTNVNVQLQLIKGDGTTVSLTTWAAAVDSSEYTANTGGTPIGRGDRWVKSEPIQVPADGDYSLLKVQAQCNWRGEKASGTNFHVDFATPILRSVADPRIAWSLPTA